jgi:UDP-N-acetyl-D-mannosaminuronic acid transferase (WecB/TagA/CpsF family)
MQRVGLEWLYRLLQDPSHLAGRYLYTNTVFVLLVAGALLRRSRHR